jgi:hypothetical protein
MLQILASLTDDLRGFIYNHKMFNAQATNDIPMPLELVMYGLIPLLAVLVKTGGN